METAQLIAEIARTTGIRLDRSDPILAAAVINEVLLDQSLVKLDRHVKAQADRVTAASNQAVIDARKEAEALINEVGDWIDARIRAAGEAAAASVLSNLQRQTQLAERAKRVSVKMAWLMGALGAIVLSGVGGMLLGL